MKTTIVVLLLFCVFGGFSQSLSDSLLIHYSFDGHFSDSSANQNHGLSNAEFCPDYLGKENSAVHFNGYDQYLNFPVQKPELKPPLPVSFAFRVMFEDYNAIHRYIFDTDYDQDNHSGIWMNLLPTGQLSISYGDATQSTSIYNRRTKSGTTVIELNQWYYVIAVMNGPEDMEVYIDCNKDIGYYEGYGGDLGYTDCQGNLGRIDGSVGVEPYYFLGSLDDFRYWNKALSLVEIDTLCQMAGLQQGSNEQPGNPADMIEVYPNPVADVLFLRNIPESVKSISITNDLGAQVDSKPISPEINVSKLTPGNYLLHLLDENQGAVKVLKFIKI